MNITPFFLDLRSAYQSEIDDLRFDSEGRDVLRQRLADKRREVGFLVLMMELSPEMVAVIFHQGFEFRLPALMDNLLSLEADEFPEWSHLADGVHMAPWAHELAQIVLKEPGGEWFLTVAAGLEYMAGKPALASAGQDDHEDQEDDEDEEADDADERTAGQDAAEEAGEGSARARREAGDDWMVEQGFDRKD
ncbi:MAG: hypothetical protein B7Y42_14470 [Polaromonas sp. 28-63-22]|nr:MAG: hypothetical protein B7Y42_14470 [Polaromonas sp. 28-63-22]